MAVLLTNKEELSEWLFNHVRKQKHRCDAVKGEVPGEEDLINVAWVDTVTGERFDMVWAEEPRHCERCGRVLPAGTSPSVYGCTMGTGCADYSKDREPGNSVTRKERI